MDTSYRVTFGVPHQTCELPPACACGLARKFDGSNAPCGYCSVAIRSRKREADTREEMRAAADERLAAVSAASRAQSQADFEEYRTGALAREKERLSQPPSKPSKKRGTGAKRGPQKRTFERWKAEDAARGTSVEEFPVALLDENDPLPPLPFELDDLQKELTASLEGEK